VSFSGHDADFGAMVADADILIISSAVLRKVKHLLPLRLKLIFCTSAGLDSLQPFDWLPPGCLLLNNSGVHGMRAGEYVAMALLMLNSHMPALITAQREQRWDKRYASILAGRRLVVVGTGDLGASGARAARLFGVHCTGVRTSATPHPDFDRMVAAEDLDVVLPEADFLLIATPLTNRTRGMLTRERIALLPQGAGVINVGRGAVIDQDALCDALDTGALGGAVLDVFTPEPIPLGHRLWTTRNLVITPHVSADDPATYAQDSLALFLLNLAAFEAGDVPPNLFDIERGY
jgi:phosphoglycerate dehydrogenase-like enzyme